MTTSAKRSTIYFDQDIHAALRLKAAHSEKSLSELVNDAVRASLAEDQEDIAAFEDRINEPKITYETLLNNLKKHGSL